MEEAKYKDGELSFKYKLKKGDTFKISNYGKFYSISIFKKPQRVKGVASICGDGRHVLFIDYDDVPRWLVEQDYNLIQENYNLPQAYLFATKEIKEDNEEIFGNYHIICLAKFFPSEIYKIISKTHADINFMSMPLRNKYRNWVLRTSNKKRKERPKFVQVIGKLRESSIEISKAHLDFLNKIYDLQEIKYENIDGGKSIFLQEYETSQ